jgi:regulatory protein
MTVIPAGASPCRSAAFKSGLNYGKLKAMGKEKARRPLTAASLEAAALRYLERFQTTRARLARHLAQKVRASGWEPEAPPDIPGLVERLAARGYLDEAAFADARVRGMVRKGLGARRVADRLIADGVEAGHATALAGEADEEAQARAFARRKRLGPHGEGQADRARWQRDLAAMLRAGHRADVARRVLREPREE